MSCAPPGRNRDIKSTLRPLAFDLPGVVAEPPAALLSLRELGACFLWEEGGRRGRGFLGLAPRAELVVRDGKSFLSTPEKTHRLFSEEDDPFTAARRLLLPVAPGPRPPMLGGAVGFLSYDAVRALERLPSLAPDVLEVPEAAFLSLRAVLAFEEGGATLYVLAAPGEEAGAETLAARVREALSPGAAVTPLPSRDGRRATPEEATPSREEFLRAVERAREAILAGEIFQIVLARRFSGCLRCPPALLYQALREISPAPYQCYLEVGGVTLLSSSPEALLVSDGARITTWPIAGTRPRGANKEEDRARVEELLHDPKERAEHVMLVDLARNDLGRVSRPGSVVVRRFLEVEPRSHVFHLVSEVDGLLREGASTIDALRVIFPAGTVSGAPKVRAMELIEALEGTRRGCYAGAFGYLGPEGEADFAITIRTLLLSGGRWHAQAGAGIVYESEPAREAAEIDAKAAAMLEAVALAERAWEREQRA